MIFAGRLLIPRAGELLREGAVCIRNGVVIRAGRKDDVVASFPNEEVVDYGDCLITPAFINYHCHLELEFCRGKVSYEGDFVQWLQRVRDLKKTQLTQEKYFPEASVRETLSAGVTTMIDHYTMNLDFEAISRAGLRYFGLRELFEFNNHNPDKEKLRESTVYSFAIHSPYTTSAEVARTAFELAIELGRPVSMHLSEMKQEIDFITRGSEAVANLLRRAGSYDESWRPPGVSPVRYFSDLGVLSPYSYCVHLNYYLEGDIEVLARSGITHIYCPRSHKYFEHPTHPLMDYRRAGIPTCLGTDSYGSYSDLRILAEAKEAWNQFPELDAEEIFEMLTTAGLRALRLQGKLGELVPGAYGDIAAWEEPQGENFDEVVRWLVTQRTSIATIREGRIVYSRYDTGS